MNNKAMTKLAVSSLISGLMLVSCSGTMQTGGPANLTQKAERSLKKGKVDQAIQSAEAAVLAAPYDADARSVLAQAYLGGGRFLSAEKTFEDALELGDEAARTVISLALSQIAQGKFADARKVLQEKQAVLPKGDYGLAVALAGDTQSGVNILSELIRSGVNTPKTRQNLAFAYALNGQWREAKLMASQDVDAKVASARILQWASLAKPGNHVARVASLLNVTPAQVDNGQPVQLALKPKSDNANAVAVAVNAMDDVKPVAALADKPVKVAPVKEAEKPAVKPVALASAGPVAVPAPKTKDSAKVNSRKPIIEKAALAPSLAAKSVTKTVKTIPAPRKVNAGSYVLQLGAFSTPKNARNAWGTLTKRYTDLAAFGYASSTVKSRGKTLYRIAATGFGNEATAKAMCDGIKARGGSCIVRKASSVQKSGGTRLAARK